MVMKGSNGHAKQVLRTIDSMRGEIICLSSDLVKRQSINPLYTGVDVDKVLGGEKECNEFLAPILKEFGCKTDLFEKAPKRTNLVGVLKGSGGGKSLILNGHIDTVPFGKVEDWTGKNPVSGKVKDGKLYGRGSCDMKAGIAAMIKAIEAVDKARLRLKGDIIFESVVGEEVMSHELGTSACIERGYKADAAIDPEPTVLTVMPVTSGLFWMKMTVEGKPTHSCVRDEIIRAGGKGDKVGVNALEKGVKLMQAIQELEQQWGITKQHPLFNPGHFVLHPGVIDGAPHGVRVPFVVSSYCTIDYAIWHHPRETAERVKKEVEDYITKASKLDSWLRKHPPKVEWLLHWPPGEIPSDHPICRTTASAHRQASGKEVITHAMPAVTDVAFLDRAGVPSIMYGPGDVMQAHTIDEYVPVDQLVTATKTLALTAMDWCGVTKK